MLFSSLDKMHYSIHAGIRGFESYKSERLQLSKVASPIVSLINKESLQKPYTGS